MLEEKIRFQSHRSGSGMGRDGRLDVFGFLCHCLVIIFNDNGGGVRLGLQLLRSNHERTERLPLLGEEHGLELLGVDGLGSKDKLRESAGLLVGFLQQSLLPTETIPQSHGEALPAPIGHREVLPLQGGECEEDHFLQVAGFEQDI